MMHQSLTAVSQVLETLFVQKADDSLYKTLHIGHFELKIQMLTI